MIPTVSLDDVVARDPWTVDVVHTATRDIGLFYLDGGPGTASHPFDISRRFFALPPADKRALSISLSPAYRGYVGVGEESTNGAADLKESFEFGKEDIPPAVADPPPYYRMYGGNQWPAEALLPGFRAAIEAYSAHQARIGAAVVGALAATLDQPAVLGRPDAPFGTELSSFARVIYYANPSGYADGARLAAHTDSGMVTVSVQDTPGLEARTSSGEWIPVVPPDGCCVVFTGELLELWSRGYYRACVHRVHNASLARDRVSLITFFLPDLRSTLRPLTTADSARLAGAVVPRGNSWLTDDGAAFVVGEREWARVGEIF
ncbi:2-oxoglutarate and iron-dependent oxygenase domain-containing protein [Actinokineospora cianjurensis]|uniref:Isopenicillin N synthase-like dioxygenase n=1 Tax=Actinokineospora cianjurensis TaxID=585224 RepID=A0A421B9Y1_9PSEU|nr:2-oxoglutarate and iron-dependent oxygenase domain-containing protein [Actinokineospora cianjurensis]RLK61362.1 isopenicillin N synthase-like dioxygenase [Actinokineospora cianjurensis]